MGECCRQMNLIFEIFAFGMDNFSSEKNVSLLRLFLFFFSTVVLFGSAHPMVNKLCEDLDKPEGWQLLKKYNNRKVPDEYNVEFPKWKDSYKSIKKFIKYCNYLQKNEKPVQENDQYKLLALKPKFLDANKNELKISEAMSEIVEAYKIMLSKLVKMKINITEKLEEKMLKKLHLYAKKELPVMEFTNRSDCLKVSQWVSIYTKNNTDEEAKAQLSNVKQHIFNGEKLDLSDPPAKNSSKKLTSLNKQKSTTSREKTDEKTKKIEEGLKKVGKKMILKKEKKTKSHKENEEEEEEEEEESSSSSSSNEVSDQQSNDDNFWSGAHFSGCFTGNGSGGEDGPTINSNDAGCFSGLFNILDDIFKSDD
uniref:Secretory protein 33A09 n=1 Tax=Heterodera glycines TaxID=51029 RepID=A0A7D6HM27_HETGL|nr:secretory protein 33A09 [Heterodera glycines]